ncbi:MAG TPA: hypothetical protein VLD58_06250, partial [Gemmatimonadales bacterium]|nr:hypothetical protein [Gemmatimonadales bacterium]
LADLLVVEFRDLADDTGTYHSASAFKIGDHIIPVHFLTSKHWVLKWDDSLHDETAMAAHLAYVRDNPHEAWLRRVFELAQVGYGRIDYGICGDTLRLWEINLNPTFSRGPGPEPPPFAPAVEAILEESRVIFHGGLKAALRSLDPGVERSQVAVRLDPALVARLRADSARGRRRQSVLQLLHRLYRHPRLGWLFRMAYHRLVPRQ